MKSGLLRICVPVCVHRVSEMESAISRAAERGDIVELRLDYLDANAREEVLPFLRGYLNSNHPPMLLTLRPAEQGGHTATDPAALDSARRSVLHLTAQMQAAIAPFSALILPTTLTPALPFSDFDGKTATWTPMRTIPFNVTGQPALSLPIGFSNGLPLGMQIVGMIGADDIICRIGHAFECATNHALMHPAF